MSLRFQRRIKIAPGVRLNMSLGGISVTTGIKGASLTFSKRGVHANLGLPGSGLHYRTRLSGLPGLSSGQRRALSQGGNAGVQIDLDPSGRLLLLDEAGDALSESRARKVRKEQRALIDAWLEARRDTLNADRERALALHLDTPDPDVLLGPVDLPAPAPPAPPAPYEPSTWESLMAGSVAWMRDRIDFRRRESEEAIAAWEAARAKQVEAERLMARAEAVAATRATTEPEALADKLGALLASIPWPRETEIGLAVREAEQADGEALQTVLLDVDLPEAEDMPREEARVSKRPVGIKLEDRSDRAARQEYMRHVHGVGFRLIGEVFLATQADVVVLSAATQRVDPATGAVVDVYLYSVRVTRAGWTAIDFGGLEGVDPVAALGQFELRRSMSKTGIFKGIEPFEG